MDYFKSTLVLFVALLHATSSIVSLTHSRYQYIRAPILSATSDSIGSDDAAFWSDKEKYILSGEVFLKEKFVEIDKKRSKEEMDMKFMEAETLRIKEEKEDLRRKEEDLKKRYNDAVTESTASVPKNSVSGDDSNNSKKVLHSALL